jgi:acetyl esterase/lipase/2-keto-4-pentenoate hydratase
MKRSALTWAIAIVLCATALALAAAPDETFRLWPAGQMPGQARVNPAEPERIITDRRRPFYQITNVSTPTVSVFLPSADKRTGGAVLVCPGGGMQRLAYEHEGLEIADWLNPLGISVFVLKYRVPGPSATALLDAQRAMGLIRQRATEFKIDPERIGAMGFSAGAEVALLLAVNPTRTYEPLDAADKLPCRPDNVCLVYAGVIVGRGSELRTDIASKLDARTTPSMFIVHAFGDASDNSLALALQLKRVQIPSEIHIYQEGGHGFGARDSALPLAGWKAGYVQWITSQGFLDKPQLVAYAKELASGSQTPQPLSAVCRGATLAEGYAVQRRYVGTHARQDRIAGYKSAATTSAERQALGVEQPLTGVLFRGGRIDASSKPVVKLEDEKGAKLQLQIGYVVSNGVDISTRIHSVEHIKGAFEAIVPVVELPARSQARSEADLAAVNLSAGRYIVARSRVGPDDSIGELKVALSKDGQSLLTASADATSKTRWESLIAVVNQIVDQGYALHSGDLVLCGSAGTTQEALPGKYRADFGTLGVVEFELQ